MEMKRNLVCKSSEAHFTAQYYITYGHSLINNLSVLSTPADVGNVYFPCLFLSVQWSNCLKSAWNLDRACEFCGLRAVEKQWQSVMAWEHSWLEKRPRIDARLRGFAEMAWIWSWKECIWYKCLLLAEDFRRMRECEDGGENDNPQLREAIILKFRRVLIV